MQSNIVTQNNKSYLTAMIVEDGSDNTLYLDTRATNHVI